MALFFLFIMFQANGQEFPEDNSHTINNDINKFVGTWKWTNQDKSFTIILKKETILYPMGTNITVDNLIGFHKYTVNNVIIENSTEYSNTSYWDRKTTIFGKTRDNPNKVMGSFEHLSKNKSVNFTIEYIDATHFKLLSLEQRTDLYLLNTGESPRLPGISLPQNIIFTKQ